MDRKNLITIVLAILVYFLSAGISYFIFSSQPSKKVVAPTVPVKGGEGQIVFDASLPRTESCPLNGELYSKQQKDWWEKHRPLGIMIENHENARSQSGLTFADVVYEAVAEGGITRLLAVFHCQDAGIVGPVRSARTYFLDFISEYGSFPLYTHVGGANQPGPADALSQIADYEWNGYNDLNQFSIGFPTFWRDYNRLGHPTATEHTMYSTTDKLWQFAKNSRDLTDVDKDGSSWSENFVPYSFKEDESLSNRPVNQTVHLEFWSTLPDYFVDWKYDQKSNTYKRINGGKSHKDLNNDKQVTAKNIVVLFMRQSNANDGYENNIHLLYRTKGTGKATIFQDGKKIEGTWRKDKRTSRTLLFDSAGNSIKLTQGLIWFSILPLDGVLDVR